MSACSEQDKLEKMEESEKAFYLAELAEKALTKADTIYYRRHLLIKNPYFNSSCTVDESVNIVDTKNSFGYINNTRESLRMGEDGQISTSEVGYKDGYTFAYHKSGTAESRFKAPMTEKEYREIPSFSSGTPSSLRLRVEEGDCAKATVEHQEDGDWLITYEGFTETRAYNFTVRQHDLARDLTVTHKPWDLTVSLLISPEFEPIRVIVDVKFHDSKEYYHAEPTVSASFDFSFGDDSKAKDVIDRVDLSKYTELENLGTLNVFFDGLNTHVKAAEGEFTVDTTTTFSDGIQSQSANVVQTVEYANTVNGYRFSLEYEQNEMRYELTYAGTHAFQTVYGKNGNKLEETSMRIIDAQARLTVADYMNRYGITPADVVSVELFSEGAGLYRYALREDSMKRWASAILRSAFADSEIKILSCSAVLNSEILNGVMENYSVTLQAEVTVDGETVNFTSNTQVVFY
jgi:hypothetical protein